jgi:hypothetical protein
MMATPIGHDDDATPAARELARQRLRGEEMAAGSARGKNDRAAHES